MRDLPSYRNRDSVSNNDHSEENEGGLHFGEFSGSEQTEDGKLRRNQLACLFLAQGVPLLLAGDEAANTQNGNNNAYCQDNETGWVDWSRLGTEDDLTDFVGELARLRQRFPQLKPHRWVEGKKADGSYDVKRLTPKGRE